MQKKIIIQTLVLALVAALGLVGCKKKPQQAVGPTGTGAGATPPPVSGTDITGVAGLPGSRPELSSADLERRPFTPVYFDYDSARIKPSELPKLQAVADALKGNNKKLIIEGHCDERGTAEYNRALGERRALAAKAELERLGIDASRITTISYGKERPVDPGHGETAWSRNRRCEFVVLER
ncbi:MAG: OmpA family protein [Verrucomicrobiae bacterium]|nr:OmpA family protein [Verrucomicrobiae bacterium]